MTTEVTINGNTVWRDDNLTHRWYDAVGPEVCKFLEDFVYTPFSAADQLAGWLATLVEAGADETTAALTAGAPTGVLHIKTDENDNDGWNGQALGEAFYFGSRYPTYFGCRFKISDADQSDAAVGLVITDTTVLGGATDGLYFRTNDGETTLSLIAEKDSLETVIGVATLADSTYLTVEYLYSGGILYVYLNGVQVAELADSDPNFPDNEYLTPTIAVLAGQANAGTGMTMDIDWIKAIQIQAT